MQLRVAAIQMNSVINDTDGNLMRAEKHIEAASNAGATLILLPELLSSGYAWTTALWDAAESRSGSTVQWMCKVSRKYSIYLGTSYLEVCNGDFFNTFVLTNPDGSEAGRVRKRKVPAYESFFYKGDKGSNVIETKIGNVGVGICYDSWFSFLPKAAKDQHFDILLLPHSAPTPQKRKHIPQKHIDQFNSDIKKAAERYAELLGIPVVLSNKCGKFKSSAPLGPYEKTSFPGFSTIADSDAIVRAQLGSEEGYIVADVKIDPKRKKTGRFHGYGRWAWEGPWQRNLMLVVEFFGRIFYRLNRNRKEKAYLIEKMSDKPS